MSSERIVQFTNVQREALNLFRRKNNDYGDSFAQYGSIGVIVRMSDKINRLMHISNHSIRMVSNETMRDTLIDLHNYTAMAIMLLDESN